MTPIRPYTAKRLGLRKPESLAAYRRRWTVSPGASAVDFEAVIANHVEQVKSEWDPATVALFDAERYAAAMVEAARRETMARLQRHTAERAVTFQAGFEAAFRAATQL